MKNRPNAWRRGILHGAGLAAAMCVFSTKYSIAAASTDSPWPARPLKIVLASSGGLGENLARMIGETLERDLGQPVIIESRTGASGNIASGYVAHADANGYTLL